MNATEAAAFFKSKNEYRRLFKALYDKYRSYGRFTGMIVLKAPTDEEVEAVQGLATTWRQNGKDELRISAAKVVEAYGRTRFGIVELEAVLEAYHGKTLVVRRAEKTEAEERRESFFSGFTGSGEVAFQWIEEAWRGSGTGRKALAARYERDPEGLKADIVQVMAALAALPVHSSQKQLLPVFSAQITADPHAFDSDRSAGQLLLLALAQRFSIPLPKTAEARQELLYAAGLLPDDVSSLVACCGLIAWTDKGKHPGWEGFYHSGESIQITVENLSKLSAVTCPAGAAYVVENPAVYTLLRRQTAHLEPCLVCTSGNPTLPVLYLLDMLAASGASLYYSGDFDPEGLQIADRLKIRYGRQLVFWRMTPADYRRAVSKVQATPERLNKLNNLKDEDLAALGRDIAECGYWGYQESLVNLLLGDFV